MSESPYDNGESPTPSYNNYKYHRQSDNQPSSGESPSDDGESPQESPRKNYRKK